MSSDPQPLSRGIDRLLASLRGGSRQTTVTVFSRWEDLVGQPVATHVRPLKIDRGTLVVEVDDPAWATQMKFLESDLLARLNTGSTQPVERLEIKVKRHR